METNLKNAILGGVAGTIVMTLMMMVVAPMMTGMPMDIAAMLAGMLGGSYMLGMLAHIMMGVIVFPLVYVFAVQIIPGGSGLKTGLIWGVTLWIAAVVFVMPMAGAGFLMANVGGMVAVMASLMGHLVYGGLLGALAAGGEQAQTT
ncbi:MAG: hypothetical protein GY945_11555 [Rhodobacteraceae bacterium]|nr:hypothetical protein [Paracoccaceae bacterium]